MAGSARAWLPLATAAAGAAAGIAANLLARDAPWLAGLIAYGTEPVGQVFLRLLFMLVVPLLFSALVLGVSEVEVAQLGKMGLRMLGYTLVVSAIAAAIGLALTILLRPGEGFAHPPRSGSFTATPAPSGLELIVGMVPDNPVAAAAQGDMLGLIVFSLIFGVALSITKTDGTRALRSAIAGLYDVTMRLIAMVLRLLPVGVFALVFTMTARLGLDVLTQLASYVGVVMLGLALHMVVVYSISVRFLGGMSPLAFFRGAREAMLTAFSTSSSSASLPTVLRVAKENLHLPDSASRFVLTAGAALNQNGTALFEGVTVLFLAQVYGVDLTIGQQVTVMGLCILGGIGTAGVPAGSLPVIASILAMMGIPPEGLGLVLGVDRLLDMSRTTLNVTGDLAAAVYVARHAGDEPATTRDRAERDPL
ncbi:MAG: dicarboxylate/amino acid:cation symporter [Sandaracinaceae bacterium]|nr:dicarboxylate/amino acid:cation symporter [Sandaracinaceae bacterium]